MAAAVGAPRSYPSAARSSPGDRARTGTRTGLRGVREGSQSGVWRRVTPRCCARQAYHSHMQSRTAHTHGTLHMAQQTGHSTHSTHGDTLFPVRCARYHRDKVRAVAVQGDKVDEHVGERVREAWGAPVCAVLRNTTKKNRKAACRQCTGSARSPRVHGMQRFTNATHPARGGRRGVGGEGRNGTGTEEKRRGLAQAIKE